jgi:hypothetical protein
MNLPQSRHTWLEALALVAALPLVLGCESQAEIRTYTVKKESAATAPAQPAAAKSGEATDRMIGAILPAGDRSWYFKATGPIAAMEKHAKAITAFFESVSVKPGAEKPEWKLPEGWTEEAGTGMRLATLVVSAEEPRIEMTVIALPSRGAPGELLDNVNRWRGQMNLPHVDVKGLADSTTQKKVGDGAMTIVDLRGSFSNTMAPFAGRAPFAGGAANPGAPQTGAARTSELPPGHPPVSPHGAPAVANITFQPPKTWPKNAPDEMRKANFVIADAGGEARVTVIDFPAGAGPKIGDPLENFNRWRQQVGLQPVKQEELETVATKVVIDGKPGHYSEMIPPEGNASGPQPPQATVAAMVSADEVIWFFKLTGDRELVARERDNFKAFLESVSFKPANGAGDGN